MRTDEIKPGKTYRGGKAKELRAVISWGSTEKYVCWAPERERLPLGGFAGNRCTERASFAKWAVEEWSPAIRQQEIKG